MTIQRQLLALGPPALPALGVRTRYHHFTATCTSKRVGPFSASTPQIRTAERVTPIPTGPNTAPSNTRRGHHPPPKRRRSAERSAVRAGRPVHQLQGLFTLQGCRLVEVQGGLGEVRGALRGATWRGMGGGKPVVPRVFLSKPGRNSTRFVTIHIEALVIYIYYCIL